MSRPNIVFILVDALRASSVGCYGYTRQTTPNIDEVAKKGALFEKVFCSVNASDPSLTTMMTGLYPRTHGIIHHGNQIPQEEIDGFAESGIKLLPEILKENGYKTYGLDWMGRWHKRGYDYYAGFNVDRAGRKKLLGSFSDFTARIGLHTLFKKLYYMPVLRSIIGKFDLYSEDGKLTKRAVDIINSEDEPFFMFIHYWGLHAPYNCPRKYSDEFLKTDSPVKAGDLGKSFSAIKNEKYRKFYEDWTKKEKSFDEVIARHDGAIKQIDDQIGQVMEALRRNKQLENTIIVITSDHGESLVEHSILFDHHGLYDASIHVPLVISYPPAIKQGVKVNALVQHVDIAPTLMSLAAIEELRFDGQSVLGAANESSEQLRTFVFAEENYYENKECIRTSGYKLIRALDEGVCSRCGIMHGDKVELYNLNEDPAENNNLALPEKEAVKLLTAKLDEYKMKFAVKRKGTEERMLDKAISDIKL